GLDRLVHSVVNLPDVVGADFPQHQINGRYRGADREAVLAHQQTPDQRYSFSNLAGTASEIFHVVNDAPPDGVDMYRCVGNAVAVVVDVCLGVDKAVVDTWNNFWKDAKADGIGSNVSRK